MKFLILRFSSIGDIVLTTTVIRCLKKKYPEAEIHFATKKIFYPILGSNPYLKKIHQLNGSLMNFISDLKKENFDYIIDLHHNQRTSVIKLFLGVKSYSFNKINFEKWLMVNFRMNRLPDKHIVDRYLETVEDLGVENDGRGLDYFIPDKDEVNLENLPREFHPGYIAWVIGAKQNTKKFPAEKIIRVINQSVFPFLILGGKEDSERGEHITRETRMSSSPVLNTCGKFTLNQSASLIKQSRFVITNDTGLMHIAAAFRKPVISIWGNTIPGFGMNPYYGSPGFPNSLPAAEDTRMELTKLDCRPCSKLGFDNCPKGHFNCMNLIDEQTLVEEISRRLSKT